MTAVRLFAPPHCILPLANALQECGIRRDNRAAFAVIVSSLSATDIAATAELLTNLYNSDSDVESDFVDAKIDANKNEVNKTHAIVAAQVPLHFPFYAALTARAKKAYRCPILAIPSLQHAADFADAAKTISDSLQTLQMQKATSATSATPAKTLENGEMAKFRANDSGGRSFVNSPAEAVLRARRALNEVL